MLEEQLNQLYEGYGYRKFRMSKFEDYDLYAQNKDFLKKGHIITFTDVDGYSSYDRQERLLAMILKYDRLCRDAIAKGAPTAALFQIGAREKIGRAKSVPAEEYAAVYDQIQSDMEQQIAAIAAKGGDDE